MRVIITGRHVEVTVALRRYVETRMKRLDRYGLRLGDVQVVLAVEKYRHAAEVMFKANGVVIQGKASTREMYSSVDQLIDKVTRQLVKRKEKLADHKLRKTPGPFNRASGEPNNQSLEFDLVRTPLYSLTTEEAINRLDPQPSAVLVFKERSTDRIQVVRRLENGQVELIDPQPI